MNMEYEPENTCNTHMLHIVFFAFFATAERN